LEIDKREWNYILKDQLQESERIEAMRAMVLHTAQIKNQQQFIIRHFGKKNLVARKGIKDFLEGLLC
jgi:hypothetical protein